MPQPLSSVKRDAKPIFDPIAADKRPELASLAAKTIAISASIEHHTVGILAEMLGSNALPAAAMFMSLRSSKAQTDALEAVAEAVLKPRDLKLLGAIREIVARASADRNKFAHWIWGYSEDLPYSLLLHNPTARRSFEIDLSAALAAGRAGDNTKLLALGYDARSILVYNKADIEAAIQALETARKLVYVFRQMLGLPEPRDQLYAQLAAHPEVAEELARLDRNRQNTQ